MRFGDVLKTKDKEGKEKHVPTIELKECAECEKDIIVIEVGKEVAHPNTVEHHIKWIQLYGLKKDNNQVIHLGSFDLGPAFARPKISTYIKTADFKTLLALEYCNLHGVWENSVDV